MGNYIEAIDHVEKNTMLVLWLTGKVLFHLSCEHYIKNCISKPPVSRILTKQLENPDDQSGQIIIFHQPGFPWNKGDFPSLATFWGEVVWGRYNLTSSMQKNPKTRWSKTKKVSEIKDQFQVSKNGTSPIEIRLGPRP